MLDVLMASGFLVVLIMSSAMLVIISSLQDTIAYKKEQLNWYRQEALSLNETLRLDKRDGRL